MDINVIFCRSMLSLVMADIKPITTVEERKEVWVYDFGRDHWEFHGPNKFYWHGSADNAYDARCKGWHSWLRARETEPVNTKTRAVLAAKSGFRYGGVVYAESLKGWRFIPNVAHRKGSRKVWPTPEAAVPRWAKPYRFQEHIPVTRVGEE